jgi:DNA-binding XRE family transcriptional regulator
MSSRISDADTITLSRAECEALTQARAAVRQDVAASPTETFTEAELAAYLASPTALAFWRKYRGVTQAALAADAGGSQPYLAQVEGGAKYGTGPLYARLARALQTRIEDILPVE